MQAVAHVLRGVVVGASFVGLAAFLVKPQQGREEVAVSLIQDNAVYVERPLETALSKAKPSYLWPKALS